MGGKFYKDLQLSIFAGLIIEFIGEECVKY